MASVASVTSATANGTYMAGAVIDVTVNFSESVTLAGGNLLITLDTGALVTIAPFGPAATASGTYTVAAGQNSADLTAQDPLTLSGGSLRDAATNNATLTIPAGQNIANLKDIVVTSFSVAASNSTFSFGNQVLSTWLPAGTSVLTNDGSVTATLLGQISTFTAGANTWALSATSNGASQIRAQWSTTSAAGPWTDVSAYATNFTIVSGLAVSGTVNFYFRIQTPTSSPSQGPYSSQLTVTAQ